MKASAAADDVEQLHLMADLLFISIRTPVSTPGPLFSGVTARSAQLLSTELGMYRVLDLKNQWVKAASPSWANPMFAMR
jgi:hypothetical protein